MKVVGHVHTKHNLEPARKYEIGTIVECECGQRFVSKGGVGLLGPFYYWDNYQSPIVVKPTPGRP